MTVTKVSAGRVPWARFVSFGLRSPKMLICFWQLQLQHSTKAPICGEFPYRNGQNNLMSQFRSLIPSEHFPAEKDRYVLYVNHCCPWCHRAVIAHALKGLGDHVVQIVEVDARDPTHGWYFSGLRGPSRDPTYGFRWMKELYLKADPQYNGRITVPMLWDKKTGRCTAHRTHRVRG